MRRREREIKEQAAVEQLLERCQVLRLALKDEPYPYVVPVCHANVSGHLYFHCALEGRKLDLLRRDGRVGFEADNRISVLPAETACAWGARYESVIGTGLASIVTDAAEKEAALLALMAKHSGRTDWAFDPTKLSATVVVRIDIDTLTGKQRL